jgi:inosose dehydratase
MLNRRTLLMVAAQAAAASAIRLPSQAEEVSPQADWQVATNTYPWTTFAHRQGRPFSLHSDELLGEIASTGITGYEPIIQDPTELTGLQTRLDKHGLQMRSLYVNSLLHDDGKSSASIQQVLSIAEAAKTLGAQIIVTNPEPIRWGGSEDKTDAQLRHQARALNQLGESLRKVGLTLAYHNHDSELRQGAREFHHMLTATAADNVKFCLDAHWVYRGCGNSSVALFDAVEHYGDRIVELHLRQSSGGVWTESFTAAGDIDYPRLFGIMKSQSLAPHLVLEQAIEAGSQVSRNAVEAHRASFHNLSQSWGCS